MPLGSVVEKPGVNRGLVGPGPTVMGNGLGEILSRESNTSLAESL